MCIYQLFGQCGNDWSTGCTRIETVGSWSDPDNDRDLSGFPITFNRSDTCGVDTCEAMVTDRRRRRIRDAREYPAQRRSGITRQGKRTSDCIEAATVPMSSTG
jgi:hypothetical protein